jgi:predicted transcriptional regulator
VLETQGDIEEYRLAEAFDMLDVDNTGFISHDNLREILGKHCDPKFVDMLIAEADFFNNNQISYAEFLKVFTASKRADIYNMYESITNTNKSTDEVLKRHGIIRNLRRGFHSASRRLRRKSG